METVSFKKMRKELSKKGIFHTDNKISDVFERIVLRYKPNLTEIYDPTCGTGSLLSKYGNNVRKYGQEIEEAFCKMAKENLNNCDIRQGDTLTSDQFADKKFEVIVANPPFSISWNPNVAKGDNRFKDFPNLPPKSKADYAFIIHCLSKMKDDGIFVSLAFPGILYRGNSEGKIRQQLIESNFIEEIIEVAGVYFEDTKISTAIIVFRKNKDTKDIIFKNLEKGTQIIVTPEQIKENNYNLSVSSYLIEEINKEIIDGIELEKSIQEIFLNNIRKQLEISKIMCEFERLNFYELLDKAHKVIDEFQTYMLKR